MAASVVVNRTRSFFNDLDEIGVFDPGDGIYHRVVILNNGTMTLNNVTLTDVNKGQTLVAGTLNISPLASNDSFTAVANTVLRVGGAGTIGAGESISVAGNLLSNDRGSSTVGTGVIAGDSVAGFQIDTVASGTSAKGGIFNIFSDGSFNYVNDGNDTEADLAAGDTFTYTIRDAGLDGVIGNADDLTSAATVTINFALQGAAGSPVHRVWFVDGNATVDGTGTSVSPLRTSQVQASLNNASDRDGSGQTIYIKNSVTASLQLENGQSLIGTGAALNVGGFAVASAGSNSTITSASGSTVSLADGNTVSGINIANSSTASTALSGVAVGALTINGVAVNASGAAINLSSGSIAGTGFTTVTSTSATAFNVRFSNVSGAIDLGTGALSGAANASLSIASGSPLDLSLSYAGTITQSNNAAAVSVSGGGVGITGTLTLTGAINATNGTGLQFSNADGTYNILGNTSLSGGDAGIDIGFGSSGTFNFGSAGTGTTTTITSPTGTGLSVDDNTATINYRGNITQANNAAAVNVNNHSAGTITFHSGTINATNGTGLQFSNADGTYNFNGITNLNGGDAGIDIVNGSGGVFTFGTSTSLTNASGTNFNVNGGGGNITFNGTINDTNGQLIAITGRTGGVIDFNGLVTDLVNANDGGGIAITGNTGGTVRFDGGVQLRTSSGVNAFVATGNPGMALVITDPAGATANQITATNGIALNVADTTIGAGGLVFESISASGGASGIILNTTGSTAGLTVTGSGGINSGGTILGATDAGIILTSTGPVSLTDYRVQSGADDGIRGNVVNGLTLTRASILANGNAVAERGLDMTDLRGVVNITNSTFTGSADDNVYIRNTGGSLNLTVTGSTFSANSATTGNDGLIIIGSGTGTSGGLITANISNNSFTNNRGDHFQYSTEGAASNLVFTTNITFANNTLTNPQGSATVGAGPTLGGGITVNPGGAHQTTIDINANTITNSVVSAINVQNTTNSTAAGNLNATIRNNTIGSAANNISGSHQAFGIQLEAKGAGTVTAAVTNNVVNESQDYAMFVQANDGNGVLNLTATGNTLRPDLNDPNFGREAFYVNAGSSSNNVFGQIDSHTVRLDLGGAGALRNILAGGPNGVGDYWIRQRIGTRVELAGGFNNGGNPFDGVAVQNFLNPRNLNATGAANATGSATAQNNATITTDGYHSTVGAVPTPPLPSQPLTAAAMAPDPQPELAPAGEPELIEIVEQQPQVVDDLPPAGTDAAPVPVAAASDQAPVIVDDGVLSQAELDFIVEAAIARWQAAGATPEQIATMRAVSVSVADLASLQVGQSLAGAIQLDGDAAGWRWFIDATPGADEEFDGAGTQLAARDWLGAAGTRIDLLTVVMHELGHQIGLTDAAAPGATDALMYGAITAGERRLPGVGDAAGVVPGAAPVNGALAVGPLSLGALAPGQSLTIEWRTTVDGPGEDRLTGAIVNQTSLSTTELTVQTSAADAQAIDSVRLGDRIFLDANKNGVFDAGDTGIAGVKLTLFADTNDNGLFDAGDRAIMFEDVNSNGSYDVGVDTPMPAGSTGANIVALTATTDSSGLYSFSNLAPGDYLVRVDASNFTTGGALVGRKVFATSSDPNNNVDGDNNGQDFTTFVASRAIRLDYGLETSAGPTGGASDTNNSLDMAFIQPNQAPSFTAPAFAIERVSTTSAGAQATGGSGTGSSGAAFSQTGNKIAFISAASNLVAGDANGQPDAFVKDLTTGVVTLASTSTAGVQANSSSGLVALSPDGTKVAFVSSASNLVAGDNNNAQDLFVKDLTTGVTTRVSVSTTNGDPNSTSGSPVFSPDGTKIAFSSAATNLVAGDTNSAQDIFVRDLVNNTTTRVSTTGAQGQANGFSGNVVFSPDGIQIAFTSAASNLVAGDTNGQQDVFVKNLVSGDVFRVSTTAAGGEAVGGLSSTPVFSPDGTKIAFQSFATNLVAGDTNGSLDIFVKDLNTNAVTRVSTDSAGVQANAGSSADPDFSPDGTKVVFQSLATNLVTGDTNGTFDVFVKDLITGLTTRVSTSAAGVQGNNSSLAPAFSPDGRIAFESSASNLVANDTNTQQDIFLATLGNGATTYTENGAPLAVATVVNVGDADSASYANGTFSAGITAGSVAGDLLTLASSGGASGINVVGSSVRFNNVEIGTLTSTATSLSVALNASSTDAAVKALAEAVRISSTSESPTAATRTVTFTLVDGGGTADSGQDTASFTRDVAFVPVNDAPAGADNSVSINEDTSRTFSAADFGFTDVDGNAFAGVVITTLPANGSILVNGTAIAAGAFVTAAQLAANQVTFVPTANFNGSASFTFQVRDDGATGGANQNTDQTPNTLTINVAAVNDAPTVSIQSPGAIVASGGEFLVNTTTGSNQAAPAVTALTSGGFVVTWTDFSLADGDSSTSSIKAQVFNAAGAKVGSEFLVNMQTAGGQDMTTVTGLSNGGFVISWRDSNTLSDGSSSSVKAQIYDAAGAQVGGEFLVNTQTANAQENPNITALSTGGFIVTWEDSSGQGGDASLSSVKGQLFSAAGAKIGGEILLNTSTLSFQIAPAVAGVPGGGFVVAWADGSGTGGDNDSYGIKYQLFDSSGAKVGAERLANTTILSAQYTPEIASSSGGGFMIVWRDESGFLSDGSAQNVRGQLFDAAGAKIGTEILVNTTTADTQFEAKVAALPQGGYLVAWSDRSGASDISTGVKAQQFDGTGARVGSEFRVNTTLIGEQRSPALATLTSGNVVISWQDFGLTGGDSSGSSIKAQLYTPPTSFDATEQVALSLKGSITVADVDAGGGTLTATLSVGHGILNVTAGGSGATIVSGNGTGSVVVSGTLAQLNALLRTDATSTVTYTANSDTPPSSATLSVTVNDGGNSSGNLIVNPGAEDGPSAADFTTTVTPQGWTAGGGGFASAVDYAAGGPEDLNSGDSAAIAGGASYFAGGPAGTATSTLSQTVIVAAYAADIDGGRIQANLSGFLGGWEGQDDNAIVRIRFLGASSNELGTAQIGPILSEQRGEDSGLVQRLTSAVVPVGTRMIEVVIETRDDPATTGTYVDGYADNLSLTLSQVVTSSATIAITGVNDAPAGADNSVTTNEDTSRTFSAADFGFTDVDGNAFAGVVITTLPAAGTLSLNGVAVTAGQSVTAAQLSANQLVFTPAANANGNGYASFTFQVRDNGSTANGGVDTDPTPNTLTFNVTAVNDAPTVSFLPLLAPVGGEARVNTTTAGDQVQPAAAALALGGYVVTWATTGGGIYAQRYNDNGTPAGGEILVGTGDVQAPGVVGFVELPGFTWPGRGGFAVSWNDTSGNVLLRRYDASGNPLAAASVVANSDGIFTSSAIMAFPGGATLVAWVGKGSQNTAEIFGRYFNTEGTPAGAAFKISTSNAASQLNPAVLRLPDGGWVASWTSNDGNFNEDIRAQRYDVNGNQAGGEFVVNTYTTSGQADPAMAALAGGGFVVVWRSFGQDGSLFGIYGQRFNADGTRAGGEFLVNTQTNSSQAQPTVAGLASGGFVVSWTSLDQDGDGSGVFAQNFDAFGARVGGEFRVNSVTAGNQNQSALATLPSGDLVVAWTSSGQDGSGTSIQAQRFSSALLATEQQTSDLKGRIAVADVDAGSGTLTATLSVGHGILNVTAGGSGATIVSGNGTGSVVVSGTLAQLNALLRTDGVSTITYTADTDNPPASTTFSVSVNDNGNGPAGSNLLVNGGFETQDGVNVTRDYIINGPGGVAGTANGAYFRTSGTLFGWQLAGGLEFDLETNFNNANFNTGDGTSLIDMERGAGENLSFFQDVSGIAAGTALRIGFAAALPVEYGPGQSASVAVQVYWNGALVGTVSPTSATMANFFFDVTAAASGTGAGGANRLQFIEIGNGGNDGRGTQLDAVSLRALNPQTGSSSSAIAIAAVNDAPAGVDSSGNVLDNATLTFTAASFATGMTDPEGHAFAGVRVTTLPTAGTLLLNGAAITVVNTDVTLAQLNAGQLTYQPAAGSGNTAPTFTFQVRDNGGTANGGVDLDQSPNTFTVNVAASNVAPVIDLDGTAAGTGTSVTIIENQSGNVAPNATVTDVDSANFNGGTLTVGYAAGGTASDVITVQDQGGATVSNNRIGIVGNYVFFNQVQIGTITTQGPGNGLVVTFNSAATPAAVQQLVRTVYADTLSDTPPAGARTLTFTVTDGAGGSANAAAAVTIPASNDAPTATNIAGDTVTITEPAGAATASPVRLDAGGNATIADVDNANFAGGSLTVAVTAGGASQEQLLLLTTGEGAGQIGSSGNAVRFGGTQFATFSGGLNTPLVFTFDANATPAAVQALIRNVAYFNMGGDFPVAGARTVSWSLVDGGGVANQGVDTLAFTTSVNVVASNDIPILTQPPTQNVSFTEQGPRTLLMQGVTVNDSDQPANFQGGSLSLSVTGPDGMIIPRLGSVIRTTANGDGTFVLALQEGQTQVVIGTITGLGTLNVQVTGLNTNATTTRINNLIDEFAFAVSGDTPTGGLRTVTLVMNDGGNVGGGPLTSTVVQQLEVIPVDDAPVAGPDGFTTTETASVSGTLFSNDSDVDGPALSVAAVNGNAAAVGQQIALASGARLTVNANGTFTYNPNGAFDHLPPASSGASNSVATDSFTYTLAGGTPVTVTLTINGEANGNNIIFGSAAGEGLFGGAGNDQIFGLDGDDFAQGLGGNDYIEGGNGADSLYGGDGIDTVVGAAGNDQVYGEAGDDTLYGQDGDDYLDGGAARDLLLGGLGRDVLAGGAGEDSLYGQEGDDELYGQDGNDLIDGGVGRDFLLGGTGLDLLVGGADNDALYGQDDADELYGQAGDDYLDGGAGADLLLGGAGADGLAGGDGNDSLYGQDGDDEIYGLVGDDLLDGGAGRDFLLGGAGLDLLVGGADNDRLFGQEDDDELHGQDGDDYLDGGAGRDRLFGGVGADGLVGALGDDQLFGQEGDDQLYGQEGSDYLDGGAGLDLLIGGLGRDLLVGGADNDTLLGQEDGDELYGQAGDDYLDGGDGADLLFGGLGVDLVLGGAGDDAVYGQEGNDELHGQDGNDFMDGGAGADTFFGGAGNDLLFGGAGADRLFGGTGADMFVFNAAGESAVGAADQIFDFNAAEGDKINLSGIDADTRTAATDPFTFIGTGAFTNKAGELRYEIQNGQAHVFGDVNGDGIADFQIIVNAGSLTVDNFLGVVPAAGI